ncbi:vacuolar iron transporter homolog 4-like [Salvia splendens]|uniref:vacuolar iron transporter homolog 4-like n=1 Tax=Salvia splendens TaxID=180675 RepID=UPI001C273B7C|nr:vacuolar iron transporter homolog 4-like [Salvia splendens]
MAFPNHMEITIPRQDTEQNHGNIRVVPEIEAFDLSLGAQWLQAAVLGAKDGFVSIASLMMGAGAVKGGVRALILTFLAGLFASACCMAIGELVHASSQLEVVIAQMKREGSANPSRPAVEAVIAQMRREGSAYPFRPALEATLAFSLGAFAPILMAAYITEYTVRLAVAIVASTTVALVAFGGLGAVLGRSRVVSSCVRVLVGGWIAMAITACFTKLLTVN